MTVLVRAAVPSDAAAIGVVRDASWRATYAAMLPPGVLDGDNSRWVARLAGQLEAGTSRALVAEADGDVRAFAFYGPCRDDDRPGWGEVFAIYAHPDHWSSGLGRALLPAAVEALGGPPVALWVLEANARARRFYELAGFRTDGAHKPADMPGGVQLPELRYVLD